MGFMSGIGLPDFVFRPLGEVGLVKRFKCFRVFCGEVGLFLGISGEVEELPVGGGSGFAFSVADDFPIATAEGAAVGIRTPDPVEITLGGDGG